MVQFSRAPHKGDYYGMVAFAGTGLAAFSNYLFASRLNGQPWELALTFLLGAGYIFIGSFSYRIIDDEGPERSKVIFTAIQAVLVLTVVYISPVRGFFGIIALPLASQAIFMFPWRPALLFGVGLYVATASVFLGPYGTKGFTEALLSYSPAYLFTMIFSWVTRDALNARETALKLTQELESANQRLREQAAQTEELATTRERNRLAREIHDGVGHYLTVINIQLEAARTILSTDPAKAAGALEKATRLSREALDDVRRSVGTLRTEDQRPALTDAIRALTQDPSLAVEFAVNGAPRSLSSATEHALYRAAQEGLTNVRKHARAQQAQLVLDYSDRARVRLCVRDNGQGAASAPSADGFGLRGMRERIGLLGGDMQAGPRPEGGFALTVEVPA